jgi:hypothetical protein
MNEVQALVRRADELKHQRANFDTFWQEVADYILPSREFNRMNAPGQKRMARIFNTLPILACEQLAGGLHGMLTSPQLRWFSLRCTDPRFAESEAAARWFAAVTDRMYEHFNSPKAGFATAAHELYMDVSGFGTGILYVQDRGMAGPVYRSIPLAESYIAEGEDGRIDTLFRRYKWTLRNIVATWPDHGDAKLARRAEAEPDAQEEIIHAVYPRPDGRGWESRYILMAGKIDLERGRYAEMPFIVARWMKRSGEVYGTGPGMNALPDVKLLNKMEETNLRGAQKVIDPPLMVPDDGFLTPIRTAPGSLNVFRAGLIGENDRITALDSKARPDIGADMIGMMQDRVEAIFYTRWMNLPAQPNMTATEVLQRRDEMLRLLGPMVARLTGEFLGPVIERTFRVMFENYLFPPLPPELAGASWSVEYLSPLAVSQKSSDADAIMRWWSAVERMAAVDPSVLDAVDAPEAARWLADRYNAPPAILRSREDAAQRAEAREEAAAAERDMMAADTATRAGKQGAQAMRELATAAEVGAPA